VDWLTFLSLVLALALLLPFYRVLKGPTVFDRMLGVSVTGTKTVMLICLVGFLFERIDMFVDIAVAYAMLNFIGSIVVAKYLDRTGGEPQ
jgi:multicomponent Na+:H+ antiporter subunit F